MVTETLPLQRRQTMLPHDLAYCLDGAADCGEISGAADIVLRLYGDVETLDRIWNAEPQDRDGTGELRSRGTVRRFVRDRRERALDIERYAADLIGRLPMERRLALVTYGFASICRMIRLQAEWLSSSNFEDECKGGCMKPFLKRWRVGSDMRPTKKLARRLRSPKAIRRYVRHIQSDGELEHTRKLLRVLARIEVRIVPGGDEARAALQADLEGQMESHRIRARQAVESARWQEELRQRGVRDPVEMSDEVIVRLKRGVAQKMRRERAARRKVTKRAVVMAAALLGASTVSAFAKGEPVRLDGPDDLALSAQLAGALDASGHGALAISVEAGTKRLASLCLYQDAPALDQLVSLAMHMQAGEVDAVLTTGNLFNVAPDAVAHPQIAARYKPTLRIPEPPGADDNRADRFRFWGADRERFDALRNAYEREMMPLYADAIATHVFGRAVKLWFRDRDVFLGIGREGDETSPEEIFDCVTDLARQHA